MLPRSVPVFKRKRDLSATFMETSMSVPAAWGSDWRASDRKTVGSGWYISANLHQHKKGCCGRPWTGEGDTLTKSPQLVCNVLDSCEDFSQCRARVMLIADKGCEQRVQEPFAGALGAVDLYRLYGSRSLEMVAQLADHMSVAARTRHSPGPR